jgi:hypothetical protein
MGKSRARRHSHGGSTPSVILLPPPKPPVAALRKEPEVERALRLPKMGEPLVIPAAEKAKLNREARRKSRRTETQTTRAKETVAVPIQVPPVAEKDLEMAPLPRGRALVKPRTGLVARLDAWFSRLVPRRRAFAPGVSQEALSEQMLALRTELALVQGRLDRMIAAVSKI